MSREQAMKLAEAVRIACRRQAENRSNSFDDTAAKTADCIADDIDGIDLGLIIAAHPIVALLDELDHLREQVRQHEAFQQFANASEAQRLNDARRVGFEQAIKQLSKIPGAIYHSDLRNCFPPAEWASSEPCGAAPNDTSHDHTA